MPAYKLACVMLQDPGAAEDAVQEAALKAWRKFAQLRPGSDMGPWFFGIVANECRTARRTRWWSVLKGYATDDQVESHSGNVDRSMDLDRALRRLDPRSRLVITLHYYFDMPLDQIAPVIGRKPAAVRSILYRALENVRQQRGLEDKG